MAKAEQVRDPHFEWINQCQSLRKALLDISDVLNLELATRGAEPISERPVKRAIEIAKHALNARLQV